MAERWFPDQMPPPMADADTRPFWDAVAEHRLCVQRCGECERLRHPPSPLCPACHSDRHEWFELSGRGEIYTYTVVHRPVAPDQQVPFIIVAIALEGADGLRLVSNLVDADPSQVQIGLAVEVAWEDLGPELALPRFRLR